MDDGEQEKEGGDNATTPQEEVQQPSPTSREEPPKAIGPTLNKDQIVIDSLDIIADFMKKISDQKHFLASMAFMMHTMQQLLESTREHEVRLNSYLVNDDQLQTQWFMAYHRLLPPYSEYQLVLKDSPEVVSVDQLPAPVKQSELKALVDDAVHNLYASGLQVKAQRTLDLKLNSKMDHLRDVSDKDAFPFHSWLMMLSREIGHQETLENQFFEVSSFLDFLSYASIYETE